MVLPILLLLTLVALDFGRVYLGYINIQNMARIAANFAANNPDAWGVTPDLAVQLQYKNQILADASATNCQLPKVAGVTVVPAPTFSDTGGNGKATDLGDTAEVQISCRFGVITPIISNIVGSGVAVSAKSTFAVKSGMVAFEGTGGGTSSAPTAAFTANGTPSKLQGVTPVATISGNAPFHVDFVDSSFTGATDWSWNFGDGSTSAVRDPGDHVFSLAGTYVVKQTASNSIGSSTAELTVIVATSNVDFTATPGGGAPGVTVTFTSTSTPGGTTFAWTFGAGEGSGTGATVTHKYNAVGTYDVSLTVTYPSPTGPVTTTKVGLINIAVPLCQVPQFSTSSVHINQAVGVWTAAGFAATNLSVGPGAANGSGNWTIRSQTLVGGTPVPCGSAIQVNDH